MVWFYLAGANNFINFIAFNPTMVWFYQSKSGCSSIKDAILSIPLWSDFISLLPSLWSQRSLRLSIPLWSDFIAKYIPSRLLTPVDFQSHYGLILSIPIRLLICLTLLTFNPTMVWFYLLTKKPDIKFSKNLFQSHYGLILSKNKNLWNSGKS